MSRVSVEKTQHKGVKDAFRADALSYLSFREHFTLKVLFSTLALKSCTLSTLALVVSTFQPPRERFSERNPHLRLRWNSQGNLLPNTLLVRMALPFLQFTYAI